MRFNLSLRRRRKDLSREIIPDPRIATAYTCRGLVRMKRGDPEGALKDFTKALSLDPGYPSVHNHSFNVYFM
jgi:Tfp pilus assembly protein PilF